MRVLLGAFGDPGHAFPMIALGSELVGRGHEVVIETWKRWREPCEQAGMAFAAAPEYHVFPTRERPLQPYEAAVPAARTTQEVIRDFEPDVVVADILTPAPALAAELEDVPAATLVPHVFPDLPPGFPPFSIGARPPRTRLGAALWRQTDRAVAIGLERGRREFNECRARLGLPARPWAHTGLSRSLTLVATLPQLEYPRAWPSWVRVVGPLLWEPGGPAVEPPPGDGPVVLIAPSTSQDPDGTLVRDALAGLAGEPLRVLAIGHSAAHASPPPAATRTDTASSDATHESAAGDHMLRESAAGDRVPRESAAGAPPNAVVVPWMSYARTMPRCDLVVTHGGHGTLARALVSGCPVVVVPAGGDMPENAARADWAGVGVRLAPRFRSPRGIRLAVRRALAKPELQTHAAAIATAARTRPGPRLAADELERWAAQLR